MAVERTPNEASRADIVDRVLDKGVVIDAYVRVSVIGIDLVSVDALVPATSVEDCLSSADVVRAVGSFARPRLEGPTPPRPWMEDEDAELGRCPTGESG